MQSDNIQELLDMRYDKIQGRIEKLIGLPRYYTVKTSTIYSYTKFDQDFYRKLDRVLTEPIQKGYEILKEIRGTSRFYQLMKKWNVVIFYITTMSIMLLVQWFGREEITLITFSIDLILSSILTWFLSAALLIVLRAQISIKLEEWRIICNGFDEIYEAWKIVIKSRTDRR